MPDLVLLVLKYVFLAVLYIFVGRAIRAMYLEVRAVPARTATGATRPAAQPPRGRAKKAPKKAVVVEGDNLRGRSFDLGEELTVGRAEKCHVVLDDPYVSQVHARIFTKGDGYMVEDLGSTNGTYLNRRRLSGPAALSRGDRVKIGRTVLEMRR